jgi:hypothetical protein
MKGASVSKKQHGNKRDLLLQDGVPAHFCSVEEFGTEPRHWWEILYHVRVTRRSKLFSSRWPRQGFKRTPDCEHCCQEKNEAEKSLLQNDDVTGRTLRILLLSAIMKSFSFLLSIIFSTLVCGTIALVP